MAVFGKVRVFGLGLVVVIALSLGAGADEMHFAASAGDVAGLKKLIENSHRPVDSPDPQGVTPLMAAAGSGRVESLRYLLQQKARVDLFDKNHLTALHRAVKGHHLDAAKVLLEAGAPVNARESGGQSPLAATHLHPSEREMIELLLSFKADPNPDNTIYIAAYYPDVAITRALLKAGADPARRTDGTNALDADCLCLSQTAKEEQARKDLAAILLDQGLKFDAPGLEGEIPLVVAAQRGHSQVVELFLNRGASANAKDMKGNPLLHNVASGAYLFSADTARLAIKAGADINAVNNNGATALHVAASTGNHWVVQALLEFPNLNQQARNRTGQTALDLARKNRHQKVIDLLSR